MIDVGNNGNVSDVLHINTYYFGCKGSDFSENSSNYGKKIKRK